MAEEIEWLDEELTNIHAELTGKLGDITSRDGKKLSKGARDDKVFNFLRCMTRVMYVFAAAGVFVLQSPALAKASGLEKVVNFSSNLGES